jgi:hypothetical protein
LLPCFEPSLRRRPSRFCSISCRVVDITTRIYRLKNFRLLGSACFLH